MRNLASKRFFALCLIGLAGFLGLSQCATTPRAPEVVDESQVLLNFFETERDYLQEGGPFVIAASALRTNLLTKPKAQYLIDIRSPQAFARGHIAGSHNLEFQSIYDHVKGIDVSAYENIVVICFAGQASAYAVSLLRALGYSNAVSLKWGIGSWAAVFAQESWLKNLSNNRADQFIHTPSPPKNPKGTPPQLTTGKTSAREILEARARTLFAEGYGPVMLGHCCLFNDFYDNGGFYIINYWPTELYEKQGHIPGAVNYPPDETPFKSTTDLLTLSTRIPNVIYCYTGQTSSYIAGYLRLLGYDARSLLFGGNAMIYDRMRENKVPNTFIPETEIMNYEYATGG